MAKNEGRYSRIKSRFWHDEKSGSWCNDTKFLALYFLTCPHGNILGCFVLPKLYICADLRWSEEQLAEPFAQLLREGFIEYDDSTSLVCLTNWLKHNPIENGNQAIAGVQMLKELPKSTVWESLLSYAESLDKPHMQVLLDALKAMKPLPKPLHQQLPEPLPQQYAKPVSVSVTVPVTVDKDICAPPPSSADEGDTQQPKRKASLLSKAQQERFDEFWQAYPKKRSMGAALKSWAKIKPDEDLFKAIMAGLERAKDSHAWQKEDGQYIPHPATWLNALGWKDKYTEGKTVPSLSTNTKQAMEAVKQFLAKGDTDER